MKSSGFNAVKLRALLTSLMIITIIAGVAALVVGYDKIQSFAIEVKAAEAQSLASGTNLKNSTILNQSIEQSQATISRIDKMTATSSDYQNRITEAINKYTQDSGLSVANLGSFNTDSQSTSAIRLPQNESPNRGTLPTQSQPRASVGTSQAYSKATANLTLENPVKYSSLMNFLNLLDQSLFQIQIQNLRLTSVSSNSELVNVDPLTLEVYLKS